MIFLSRISIVKLNSPEAMDPVKLADLLKPQVEDKKAFYRLILSKRGVTTIAYRKTVVI